jgi:glycosyltransferase involved in cell wall biosynthesis
MLALSVIICSHNPRAHHLWRVLDALRAQTLAREHWELLLIDNASKQPLASTFDIYPNGRHIVEQELGLAAARRRGTMEATTDLFVFVDDDNVLAPDYLAEVARIRREWPMLGVWGSGSIIPEFERQPPQNFRTYLPYLALRETKLARWSNIFSFNESPPVGAGLCVRVEVADAYGRLSEQQSAIEITDRKGSTLSGAGDYEICIVACELGLGIGQFPSLKMTHLIPKERTSKDYFTRVVEGSHMSILLLMYKWRKEVPRSPYSLRGALSFGKNMLSQRGIDRRMYLAKLRATIQARRIIAESRGRTASG